MGCNSISYRTDTSENSKHQSEELKGSDCKVLILNQEGFAPPRRHLSISGEKGMYSLWFVLQGGIT